MVLATPYKCTCFDVVSGMQIILAFGNYVNSSKRGSAYGFKLQSLDMVILVYCWLCVDRFCWYSDRVRSAPALNSRLALKWPCILKRSICFLAVCSIPRLLLPSFHWTHG